MNELKPCPFCGGGAHISVRRTHRSRVIGDIVSYWEGQRKNNYVEEKYCVQAFCKRCKSRGKPIVTDYVLKQEMNLYKDLQPQIFKKWFEEAADAWNRRTPDADE